MNTEDVDAVCDVPQRMALMEEMVYFCPACGKVSPTKTGEGGDKGWDVSCYINAIQMPSVALKVVGGKRIVDWSMVQLPTR